MPWNVVGTIWQIFARADIGLLGYVLTQLGVDYNYAARSLGRMAARCSSWTCGIGRRWSRCCAFAGLRAIPEAYYQAARIDGASRWAVFRFVQLPKLRSVLMIAVLLRFMDSFMIYTEPFVLTGGGPGTATTFLSQYLTQKAVGQFDLGRRRRSRWCIS